MTRPVTPAGDRVLAVDVGSSAIRAAVIDESGRMLASRRAGRQDGESGLTFDAEALWKQVVTLVRAVTGTHATGIRGIGVTGHIGTVFVDRSLTPLCPGRGWADSAGVTELRHLLGSDRTAELLRASGRTTVTGGALATLVHLRATDPETFSHVAHALHPKDFLVARLTGVAATDHTSAAYSGASLVRLRDWAADVLEFLGMNPDVLPRQCRSTDQVGSTTGAISRLLGLPRDVPVVSGGPDGTVGATLVLGSRSDLIADVAGTTDVLVRVVDDPDAQPPGATLNPYTTDKRWTVGGATGMTGGATSWWSQLLGFGTPAAAIERLWPDMARIGPGADGLVVNPSLSGSRFPRWRPAERGSVYGLRADHGPAHLMRAVLEAVAYTVREGVDTLAGEDTGLSIVLAGGTAKSAELAQLRADVLGREVAACSEPDVSLKGAALLALVGTGPTPLDDQAQVLRGPLQRFAPDPRHASVYKDLYQRWRIDTRQGTRD
jgi:sugar (pentulose or hexulose) kinase